MPSMGGSSEDPEGWGGNGGSGGGGNGGMEPSLSDWETEYDDLTDTYPGDVSPLEIPTAEEVAIEDAWMDARDQVEAENAFAEFMGKIGQTLMGMIMGPELAEDIADKVREWAAEYGYTDEERLEQIIADMEGAAGDSEAAAQVVEDYTTTGTHIGDGGSGGTTTTDPTTGTTTTTPGTTTPSTNPSELKFWQEFGTEWANAKKMLQAQDAFKKGTVPPLMQKYRQRLQGLSGEKLHQPITWGMGDFRSTFMPKSGQKLAASVLGSELGETDIMMPYQGEMSYLSNLQDVAMKEGSLANQLSIANIENPYDKGSWLDTLGDILKVGGQIGELWPRDED